MPKLEKVYLPRVDLLCYSQVPKVRGLKERDSHPEVEEFVIPNLRQTHRTPNPVYSLMGGDETVMLFDKKAKCLRKTIFNSPAEAKEMCSLLRHYPDTFTLVPVEIRVKGAK